jgi:replicative DNA helicase
MPHPEHHIEWVGGLLTSSDGTSTRRIMWPRLSKGGGLPPGEFIIVGARLGQGKSWAMTKMAASALMEGYTALYDSLEMTRTNITLRVQTMLSQAVGRPYAAADLMTGTTIPDLVEYREIIAHLQDHVPGALHVADTTKGRISPMTIAAQIERIQPDIVFVDYLTLLDMQGEGDWKSVAALSNAMQSLAQRYKIPIVAAAQLNRADGRTREVPGSDALARSDSVGQDADQVMNLQRKSTRVVKQKLVKNRHGMDGMSWYSEFRPGAGVIEEINQERAYELIDEDGVDEA